MQTSRHDERRRFRRLPATELSVAWRPKKGLFGRYRRTHGTDFTREGIAINEVPGTLAVGDQVEVRLELAMEASNIFVDRITATVVNAQELGEQTRLGLAFDLEIRRQTRARQLQAKLGRIEGILERSEKLRLRLQPLEAITGLTDQMV